jgi:crossover junction endodeoxyribonuclease RuvC
MTRILGIDPGSQRTGVGIIEVDGAGRMTHVFHAPLDLLVKGDIADGAFSRRLKRLLDGLWDVIATHRPDEVAIEQVFMARNPDSALKLGQARGAAICAAVIAGLPVAEYTALQVKQAVVGKGKAKKEQVQHMVRRLLALPGDPSPDAADALACAICCAHSGRLGSVNTRHLRMKGGRLV